HRPNPLPRRRRPERREVVGGLDLLRPVVSRGRRAGGRRAVRLQRIRVVAGIRASRRARLARGGARRSAALPAALLAIGVAAAACDRPSADSVGHVAATRAPVYVDSILPIEEELRRFRAGLEERPRQLTGEWTSRES